MKKTPKYITSILVFFLAGAVTISSCKKNTAPPIQPIPTGPTVTIQQLRNMFSGISIKFTSNTILNGVVTCDESSGNLYKQVYIRDNSGIFAQTNHYGAISIHFNYGTSGFLTVGDSIAINLNGSTLDKSGGGSLQIDSVTAINQVFHLKSGLNPQPLKATITQLDTFSNATGGGFIYDGHLVQLSNVEFIQPNVGTTYAVPQAPPAAPQNVNKYITDFAGNTIVAYNSGYSNFAGQIIPSNSGTITAIANLYTTMQLNIRSFADVQLTNPYQILQYDEIAAVFPAPPYPPFTYQAYSKNNPVVMAGWTNIAYIGNISWNSGQYGSPNTSNGNPPNWTYHPSASNYQSPDPVNEMWLISPPIVDNGNGKYIDFSVATQYGTTTSGRLMSVLVSRTFDGTHLDPSQWQDISSVFPGIPSNGSFNFKYTHTNSNAANPVHLAISGSGSTFYLAFKYRSNANYSDSTGTTYAIGSLVLHN
jgi:hypothetical protein